MLEATRATEEPHWGDALIELLATRSHGGAGDTFIESTTPRSLGVTLL